MPTDPDIEVLCHRLEPWRVCAARGGRGAPDEVDPRATTRDYLALVEPGDGVLDVCVRWDEDTVRVELSRWSHTWTRMDEDTVAEVVDLVGSALTGRIRVRVLHARGRDYRWEVEYFAGGRWHPCDSVSSGRGPLFRRPHVRILVNDLDPPPGIELREPGAIPRAPWIGVVLHGSESDVVTVEPDGELDLHTYRPEQVRGVVEAYIEECRRLGVTQLRIVHGKGIGNLRRTVHALLERHEAVAGFRLGGSGEGSWGATVVDLHPRLDPASR
jgi:hypothetical protein